MAACGEKNVNKILLISTLEIHKQVYTVRLTSEDIQWELKSTSGVTVVGEQQSNPFDSKQL